MTKPREFFINPDKFNDAFGLEYVALPNETRKFKGIHVREVTSDEIRVSLPNWNILKNMLDLSELHHAIELIKLIEQESK